MKYLRLFFLFLLAFVVLSLGVLWSNASAGEPEIISGDGIPPYGIPYHGFEDPLADAAFTTFGLKWDHTCITYSAIDPQLAVWAERSLTEIWGSVSPITSCGLVASGADIDIVAVSSLGSNILGQASCSTNGVNMFHCQIAIATSGRFLGVMAHEIGHTLGIGHSEYGDQLMSAYCCNPLGFDDIAAIQALYGVGVPLPTPVFTIIPSTATPIIPTVTPVIPTVTPSPTSTPSASPTPTATPSPAPTPVPGPPVCNSDGTCMLDGRWVDKHGNIWLSDRQVWWDGEDPPSYWARGFWRFGSGAINPAYHQ